MHHTRFRPTSATSRGLLRSQSALVDWLEGVLLPLFDLKACTTRGRTPQLSLPHLFLALFVGVFTHAQGYQDIWRWLVTEPLGSFDALHLTPEAVRKRVASLGPETFAFFYTRLLSLLPPVKIAQSTTGLASFASQIVALDESTLEAVHRHRTQLRHLGEGSSALLAGKIAGLWDVRRQQWLRLQFRADALAHTSVDLPPLLQGLLVGSLILEDLGYFSFLWLDWLTDHGYFFISRLKEKGSYTRIHTFYEDPAQGYLDALVWLGAYRSDRMAHAVRVIEYRRGLRSFRYVTNVLDPEKLPFTEIVQLYARRWDIELIFLLLKEHFGLHIWWSSKEGLMLSQLWVALMLAHLLTRLRFQIAQQAEVSYHSISVEILLDLLRRFSAGQQSLLSRLVQEGRRLKLFRPSSRLLPQTGLTLSTHDLTPLPQETPLQRAPRYPRKNSHPRKAGYTPLFTNRDLI